MKETQEPSFKVWNTY